MFEPAFDLLNAFPQAALILDKGRVTACNTMARHYLPQLETGAPAPKFLPTPQDQPTGSGTFTAGLSTYSYSCSVTREGLFVLFSPAPQSSLTDMHLDGALRQLRQFMGEFLVALPPLADGGERAVFHKSFYRMFRLLDNLEYMRQAGVPSTPAFRSGTLDIAGLCRQIAEETTPLLKEGGVALRYDAAAASLLIPGDPVLLRRMLLELIANSARAAAGGSILLRLRAQDGRALLTLSDSGSPPTQRQISAMLQQDSDQRIPAPGAGAGLGLSIVRHIVQLHQGSLLVEWGAGAPTSVLSLPTRPLDPRAAVRTPTPPQTGGGLSPLLVALSDVLPARLFDEDVLD